MAAGAIQERHGDKLLRPAAGRVSRQQPRRRDVLDGYRLTRTNETEKKPIPLISAGRTFVVQAHLVATGVWGAAAPQKMFWPLPNLTITILTVTICTVT